MAGRPTGSGGWAGYALIGFTTLLLTIEFLLGMWVNLYYTSLPSSISSALQNGSSMPALATHVGLGVLLGVFAIAVIAWAVTRHRPRVAMWGFAGLLGVLLGAIGGEEFLVNPGSPIYSFLMALGFLVAFAAYVRAASVLARHHTMLPPMTPVPPANP